MDVKYRPENPLALAVLSLLCERPMHPYEMASTLKERGKEKSIKLRYGSLYTVIDALQRDGFIVPRETQREGRRPERTVFSLTPSGADKLERWMAELLAEPVKEYPQFEAALSLMPVLPPETVAALLQDRSARLSDRIDNLRTGMAEAQRSEIESVFLVEDEFELTMAEAERQFVRRLIDRINTGDLGGLEFWRCFQSARTAGADLPLAAAKDAIESADPGRAQAPRAMPPKTAPNRKRGATRQLRPRWCP
jgi:DNA-binding PadR family transcriptional regulator